MANNPQQFPCTSKSASTKRKTNPEHPLMESPDEITKNNKNHNTNHIAPPSSKNKEEKTLEELHQSQPDSEDHNLLPQ